MPSPRQNRARLLAALLVLGPSGCATPPPAPEPAPTPESPGGVRGDFEVLYRGTSTRFQADQRSCPSPGLVTVRIENNGFTYRLGGRVLIETTIAPDGTLSGREQDFSVTGTATENKIEGDVKSPHCGYHFVARRAP